MPAPEPPAPTRIGIFGGTFDPPHAGHVAAARAVIAQLGLDRLLLVVANDPWQKSGQRVVSPAADALDFARPPRKFVPIAAPQKASFFLTQPDDTRIPDSQ